MDASMSAASRPGRITSLDALRGVAFVAVFVYHATGLWVGTWAVSVFFVLSGFVLTYSFARRPLDATPSGAMRFSASRIGRLYPLHLVMLAAGLALSAAQGRSPLYLAASLLATVPLAQTWFPVVYQALNSVAWYLSVTAFLYFIFPFVLPRLMRVQRASRALVGILAVFLLQVVVGCLVSRVGGVDVKWLVYCHPLYRAGDFVAGGLVARAFQLRGGVQQFLPQLTECLSILLCVAACAFSAAAPEALGWFTYTAVFVPPSALLVYTFARGGGVVSSVLTTKPVLWLAKISPYGFLVHRLVLHYIESIARRLVGIDSIPAIVMLPLGFSVTVACVYLYRHLTE